MTLLHFFYTQQDCGPQSYFNQFEFATLKVVQSLLKPFQKVDKAWT